MKPSETHPCATASCDHQWQQDCINALALHADELHGTIERQRETLDKLPKCWRLLHGKLVQNCPVVPGTTIFARVGIRTSSGMNIGVTGDINSHLVDSVDRENISITRKGHYCCVAAGDCANSREAAAALAEGSDDE